jgi:hypothetical protein
MLVFFILLCRKTFLEFSGYLACEKKSLSRAEIELPPLGILVLSYTPRLRLISASTGGFFILRTAIFQRRASF